MKPDNGTPLEERAGMNSTDLSRLYRRYIDCLNAQDWPGLGNFVQDKVIYNGVEIGLAGYRDLLKNDFEAIPDLWFELILLVADPPYLASRLHFNCTPKQTFLGLHVNGKKISFTENVFYAVQGEKIAEVWSVIDKAAIEVQLQRDR
jgi:predicted ester cyclase